MCIVFKAKDTQGILSKTLVDNELKTWLHAFLIDRKAQGVSEGTIHFYEVKFKSFTRYCEEHCITNILQITQVVIREYLLWLEEVGHNPGGRHAHFRAIRSFLYWYENDAEPKDWKNPIKKVMAPIIPREPLEPVSVGSINKLINTCSHGTFTNSRDKAILLSLLDTGARANEFLQINLTDINQAMGYILIRCVGVFPIHRGPLRSLFPLGGGDLFHSFHNFHKFHLFHPVCTRNKPQINWICALKLRDAPPEV